MTRPRRPPSSAREPRQQADLVSASASFRTEALVIAIVALGARLLHVWLLRDSPFVQVLMGDARGYDSWAQELARGNWIGQEVFYQAPLYPYFLGLLYSLFGHDLTAVRIVQAVLGAVSSAALGVAGWRFFSARVGLVAGLVMALYPTAIFFDALIQKSTLDGFFTCVALALMGHIVAGSRGTAEAAPYGSSSGRGRAIVGSAFKRTSPWLALGVVMGAMALTRENALLLILVVGIWALSAFPRQKSALPSPVGHRFSGAGIFAFALGLALVLTPVAMRNYAVGGGFYLTTSQFGPNFFIGNNPAADGTYMSLRFGRGAPEFERRDATELAQQAVGRPLTPAEVSSYWTDRALAFITSEPGAWLRLTMRKAALLVNASEMLDTEGQESHAEWSWLLATLSWIGHFGVLVPLAVAGIILSWPRRSTLWILYALTFTYAVSVVAFFVFARYRYPLVPLLILFASSVIQRANSADEISATHKGWLSNTGWPSNARAIGAAVATAIVCNWPMLSSTTMKAITETNLGLAFQEDGALERAAAHYRRAVELDPDYVPSYGNLGTVLRAQGQPQDAIAAYEQALQRLPGNADILINLGNARMSANDLVGAVEAFRQAMTAHPASVDARTSFARASYDLGSALLQQSRFADAEVRLRDAVAADASMADAHNNLGIALASQGRLTDAIAEFRRAVAIDPGFADAQRNLQMALQAPPR